MKVNGTPSPTEMYSEDPYSCIKKAKNSNFGKRGFLIDIFRHIKEKKYVGQHIPLLYVDQNMAQQIKIIIVCFLGIFGGTTVMKLLLQVDGVKNV